MLPGVLGPPEWKWGVKERVHICGVAGLNSNPPQGCPFRYGCLNSKIHGFLHGKRGNNCKSNWIVLRLGRDKTS